MILKTQYKKKFLVFQINIQIMMIVNFIYIKIKEISFYYKIKRLPFIKNYETSFY